MPCDSRQIAQMLGSWGRHRRAVSALNLEAALFRIPARDRALLCAHYLDALSLREIAAREHVSYSTVRRRLQRAYRALGKERERGSL